MPPPGGPVPEPYQVVQVSVPQREKAACRLVAQSSSDKSAGKRFLAAAAEHSIDLTHFFASVSRAKGIVREVCLAVPGSGRTAMFFTSAPAGPDAERELAEVITRAAGALTLTRLAQALLEPEETGSAAALTLAGFSTLGELLYLRRPRPASGEFPASMNQQLPASIEVSTWQPGDDPAVTAALEKSYIDTLDCPELCGVRSMSDVLASHRATGRWDPRHWWVIRENGVAHGAMLFNPCPEQNSVELVYFGLSPELRGRALAAPLLAIGLASLAPRTETIVTCAVDARNTPARKLYERFGFTQFGRRRAMVKPIAER